MIRWAQGFVGVDWGTTNRRAYLVDQTGTILDRFEDERGILAAEGGNFEAEVRSIAERLGEGPMLLAGMVGSNRGWREAAYVRCPAGIHNVAARLLWVVPGRVAIVPGLAFVEGDDADVMRGEEVQVFGLAASQATASRQTVCLPGTHTKWAMLEAGKVTSFRTVITGEMFAMLREHSILAPHLTGPVTPGGPFLEGVDEGRTSVPLTAQLFSIRARLNLGLLEEEHAASFASGLLIGCDLRAGLSLEEEQGEVMVVGNSSLTALYAAALRHCGVGARELDGSEAFVAGLQAITETMR